MGILENIQKSEDVKTLSIEDKNELAGEIREYILEVVSKNGGHLASNLGVVELTLALFSCFDLPNDKIIWDVGHQCYTHKILTGRREYMKTIRKHNGIAGFPKANESAYDSFNTGHSSTSISVALGMANANKLLGKKEKIIAVIGDGALTGGMAMEALNDAGSSNSNIIVVLNDNGMSISKNVGGITNLLTIIRLKKTYKVSNNYIKRLLNKIPCVGTGIVKLAHKIKKSIKQLVIPNMYFEDIGFTYLGPVDGHDIEKMEKLFNKANNIEGPILIHVVTKKGKGYSYAEQNPDQYHSIASFDIETGKTIKSNEKDFSSVFGETLLKLAKNNDKIVAVTAAMMDGTGLDEFAKTYNDRFFDVGIAEQHAVGMIAGMAKSGLRPFFAVYSSFLQRAYDQLIHDIAIQEIPVTICIDRAGIVGADGETHQGLFDMSYISHIPNFILMAPKNFDELEKMMELSLSINKPVAIRYPRGGCEGSLLKDFTTSVEFKKAEIIVSGEHLTIVAIGKMVERAYSIHLALKEKGIAVEVINARFLKPLDEETILKSITKTKKLITIEDGIINGGLASAIMKCISYNKIKDVQFIKAYGYDDIFVEHGNVEELENKYGLNIGEMEQEILSLIK